MVPVPSVGSCHGLAAMVPLQVPMWNKISCMSFPSLPCSCTPSFRVLCGLAVPHAVVHQGQAALLPAAGGQANLVKLDPALRFIFLPASFFSIGPHSSGRCLPPQYRHPHSYLRCGSWKHRVCSCLGNKTVHLCLIGCNSWLCIRKNLSTMVGCLKQHWALSWFF